MVLISPWVQTRCRMKRWTPGPQPPNNYDCKLYDDQFATEKERRDVCCKSQMLVNNHFQLQSLFEWSPSGCARCWILMAASVSSEFPWLLPSCPAQPISSYLAALNTNPNLYTLELNDFNLSMWKAHWLQCSLHSFEIVFVNALKKTCVINGNVVFNIWVLFCLFSSWINL